MARENQVVLRAGRFGGMWQRILCLAVAGSVVAAAGVARGQVFTITITTDENGKGTLVNTNGFFSNLNGTLQPDPGPGGLPAALTYGLLDPPGLVAGDLILLEPGNNLVSDIIRFNPNENGGSLVFYSDNLEDIDALADTGFPTALYTNTLSLEEVGPEGLNGITYTPTAGQPGFVANAGGPVVYVIQSDTVPEPASLGVLAVGALGLLLRRRRSK
jgi:hypothetical protein